MTAKAAIISVKKPDFTRLTFLFSFETLRPSKRASATGWSGQVPDEGGEAGGTALNEPGSSKTSCEPEIQI
jgi:hypothetical protein